MRSIGAILLALVALGLLLPVLAAAQPQTQDVRGELERTDRILERARDQVRISITGRANELLNQAFGIQADARIKMRRGVPDRVVLELTLKARDLARRAVEAAEIEAKAYESTRDLIESTRELIDQTAAEVRESGDEQAGRLLQAGIDQLRKAQEAYVAREYRRAIELAAIARDLVQRALYRARGISAEAPDKIETVLERTDALLDEVDAALKQATNPRAARLHREAQRLQERAWAMHREARPRLALQLTSRARQAALDALFLLAEDPDRQEVERALALVEQLINDLSSEIAASGSREAAQLLESARQRYLEAAEHLADGNHRRAFETARLADGLLRRAAEAAGIK